jgi:hypothetical protein
MKWIPAILIAALATTACSAPAYVFRTPTPRDVALAQVAADWMFHDDSHAPVSTNAYHPVELKKFVEVTRVKLQSQYATIPIDVESGTNTLALLGL